MRVTMKMATNTTIDNLLDNYARLLGVQNQMSRAQRVLNPSDDPLAVNEAIRLQTVIKQIGQYQRNIQVGESFLGLSDSTLQDVNDLEKQARALTVGMANDGTSPEARAGTVIEVSHMLEELVVVANRMSGDRYLYGGTRTQDPPFEMVGSKYVYFAGNDEDINVQVDRGSFVGINAKASDVFGALITSDKSKPLQPKVNFDVNTSTRLDELNGGRGVLQGSIAIRYETGPLPTDYTQVDIDFEDADTIEDVIDLIQLKTGGDLSVRGNATSNGLVVTNTVFPGGEIAITEIGNNTTARDLGILGTAPGGTINGTDISPGMAERSLLADLEGYYGGPISIANGTSSQTDPVLHETNDPSNYLSSHQLSGLSKGVNTDLDGELYFSVTSLNPPFAPPYQVEVFKDPARQPLDRVAVGQTSTIPGNVVLGPDNGSGLSGTLSLDNFAGDVTDIEASVEFPETFQSTVHVPAFIESGDGQDQLKGWQIHGLRKGVDTGADGTLDVEIVGGNTVNLINPDTLAVVATGNFASNWQTVTLAGTAGHEQISGSVDIEYLANDTMSLQATFATVKDFLNEVESSRTYTTAKITDDGRSIEISSRLAGATLHLSESTENIVEQNDNNDQFSRWTLNGMQQGENTDSDGSLYADFAFNAGTYTVDLYKDPSRTELVATGSSAVANATIVLSEANGSGLSGAVDLAGYIADDADIVLNSKEFGLSGKRQSDNIFSTLNAVIEAGLSNDTETLHNLIGNFDDDINRVIGGRAEIGAKVERLQLLDNRLSDESTSFSGILSERIDLDYADAVVRFQQESNVFNAALSVAGRIIPMSLVDYI